MSRKPIQDEQIFYDKIQTLIRNFFIENKNWKSGYYADQGVFNYHDAVVDQAAYVLKEMDLMKHLINLEENEDE